MANSAIYIVVAKDLEFNETYEYDYTSLEHARNHFNREQQAMLLEFKNDYAYIMDTK